MKTNIKSMLIYNLSHSLKAYFLYDHRRAMQFLYKQSDDKSGTFHNLSITIQRYSHVFKLLDFFNAGV